MNPQRSSGPSPRPRAEAAWLDSPFSIAENRPGHLERGLELQVGLESGRETAVDAWTFSQEAIGSQRGFLSCRGVLVSSRSGLMTFSNPQVLAHSLKPSEAAPHTYFIFMYSQYVPTLPGW